VCEFVGVYTFVCVYMCKCGYILVCVCACVYVCICMCLSAQVYMHGYVFAPLCVGDFFTEYVNHKPVCKAVLFFFLTNATDLLYAERKCAVLYAGRLCLFELAGWVWGLVCVSVCVGGGGEEGHARIRVYI